MVTQSDKVLSNSEQLARAHMSRKLKNPLKDLVELGDKAVMIRYDGQRTEAGPVIFAVMYDTDLAKLPESIFIRNNKERTTIFDRDSAFFVRSNEGYNLYVDTDVHPKFEKVINEAAGQNGLRTACIMNDLKMLIGEDRDVAPSTIAAYQANGYRRVPTVEALAAIRDMREERISLEAEAVETVDPFNSAPEADDSFDLGR